MAADKSTTALQADGLQEEEKREESLHWTRAASHPPLAPEELHLWRIRADRRGADLSRCLPCLGARQRDRAERMRHAGYRERYIRAQAGLRRILAGYVDAAPERIAFCYGPAGKPYLEAGDLGLAFNLSTTGDLALVGVRLGLSPERELGVDCEWIRPRIDIFGVAERMLAPETVEALRRTPEPEQLDRFYRAWTALEADAKCDGRGLFRPRAPEAPRPMVRNCIPEDGYVAALASPTLPHRAAWRAFDLD
ncbi:4'-phosphopantetheinyl transferase superfamily protein [Thiorhodococcus minor]|uniref:4'-phosphopantetheinyl transferase superfamily protein n=2 Tax=Thiorhodococcus minor TaxID=57489 RepID=A0A6M0JWD3_9GAMM|nr:4'-phosphopantetheinyl transferase superfamily protein [Thiorhodococcus minor]